MKINKTKDAVRNLLIKYPELRDDDQRLLANFWNIELVHKGVKASEATVLDFLAMLAAGQLSNAESVRRMRAKLQEEEPSLRGEVYYERRKAVSNVKSELGYAE